MTQLVIDPVLCSKLQNLTAQVELLDESGQAVGHFLPPNVYQRLLYASVKIPFSEEEIERRRQTKGGRSLAEIMADLTKS
jgi:hypothetical protein